MRRFWALIIFVGLLFFFFRDAVAQTLFNQFSQSADVNIGATVGSTTLTISGYQSPYASVILKTSTGTFLASTTADANGYFSISNVLINASNLTYCFQAVDFKRIGISEACITIPGPITGNVTYSDVFLPPTIGLSRKKIQAGQDGIIFGYSMPGATVYLNIEGRTVTITADSTGYYTYIYKNVPAGKFTITASASLSGKPSLDPTNNVILEAQSIVDQLEEKVDETIDKTKDKLPKGTFELWPFLLIGLALLVAIGILLYKLKFRLWVIFIDFFRRKRKMHHDWFLDHW